MPPRKKKDDPMAAVDALPLVQELEKALACLDAVEKDVDEGKRPGKDMDAFFQQLGRVDDAAAALPEMPIPQGALDDGADLDVVARQDLRRQLDDLAAEGHRKKNMKARSLIWLRRALIILRVSPGTARTTCRGA